MPIAAAPTVAVLGLGLVGGSLFQLLHRRGHPVVGYDIDPNVRHLADRQLDGEHARVVDTVSAALDAADLTVIAVPLWSIGQIIDEIGRVSYSGLLTDVTSVKTSVATMIGERLPRARWVGGHPMAGSEHAGFAAGSATLLKNCPWVLCLDTETSIEDWLHLARWITGLGCRVFPTSSSDHDEAVARVSHIPHAIAAALTATVVDAPGGRSALSIAAGSFRDATRVAATAPDMVAAWLTANAQAVADGLTPIIDRLALLRDDLQANAQLSDKAHRWLQQAHDIRRRWPLAAGPPQRFPATASAIADIGRAGGWITNVSANHLEVRLPNRE